MILSIEIDDSLLPALRRWLDKQVTARLVDGTPVIERHYANEEDALITVLEGFLAGIVREDPTPAIKAQLDVQEQARAALRAAVRPRGIAR